MKSKSLKKILFVFLFSALAFFAACSSSDEKDDLTDTDTVSDEDFSGDAEQGDADHNPAEDADTTPDNGDSADDSGNTTPDNGNSADDSDKPADNTDTTGDADTADDTDSGSTDDTDTTGDTGTPDESDTDFEKAAEGCTMIEVPTITMSGYPDEINGYFSPAMGGNAIDIIKILFSGGGLKEGTYALGTGMNENYAQCQQCVMVWVDAEYGEAKEYYFQTAGTLKITKIAGEGDAKRTNGNIKNLILKRAEDNVNYVFVPNGECVAAKFVEWETITDDPSTPGND